MRATEEIMMYLQKLADEGKGTQKRVVARSERISEDLEISLANIRYTCKALHDLGFLYRHIYGKEYFYGIVDEKKRKYKEQKDPGKWTHIEIVDDNQIDVMKILQELSYLFYGGIRFKDSRGFIVTIKMELPDR